MAISGKGMGIEFTGGWPEESSVIPTAISKVLPV